MDHFHDTYQQTHIVKLLYEQFFLSSRFFTTITTYIPCKYMKWNCISLA